MVQRVEFGIWYAGQIRAVRAQNLLQVLPVQGIEEDERAATLAHRRHRWLIACAPGVGERGGVERDAVPREEGGRLARNAGSPVHHRPERIEEEGADRRGRAR